tara:strand:- start:138 stop:587 length:450 start_codon:yes stop_codon:yes gene_type:complete
MNKGLVLRWSTSVTNNNSKLKATIQLPRDLDEAQRESYKADFRQKMAFLGLFLQGEVDPGSTRDTYFYFLVHHNTVSFSYGDNLTTLGQPSGGRIMLNKLKLFLDAYCNIYNFQWVMLPNTDLHSPRGARDVAVAMWTPVLQAGVTLRL